MAPGQPVIPDHTSDDPKSVITAKLLKTSANPLDSTDSHVRPHQNVARTKSIHENGTPGPIDTQRFLSTQVRAVDGANFLVI